jgi:hypothetical protein
MARLRSGRRKGGILGTLQSIGMSRGVFGNSKGWFYVGTGLWTLRTVRRIAERKPEILLREEIKPGQKLVIANGRATVEGDVLPVVRGRGGKLKTRKRPKG